MAFGALAKKFHALQQAAALSQEVVMNDLHRRAEVDRHGASFAIARDGVLTLCIAALPNRSPVRVRVVDAMSGTVSAQEITTDPPDSRLTDAHTGIICI